MSDAILASLQAIADERSVRIHFAIESGSRAWGFASPDSDFDIRFVYSHPLEWYLRVSEGNDQIARMLPGDLDLVGWELRKALRLFSKSNVSMMEHLGSPIVYLDEDKLLSTLRSLIPEFFNPIAAAHHYLGLASRIHDEYLGGPDVNLKRLFYVFRPLASCRWILLHHTMPPTEFGATMQGIDLQPKQMEWIDALQQQKSKASESHDSSIAPEVYEWIQRWLATSKEAARSLPHGGGKVEILDELLAQRLRQ